MLTYGYHNILIFIAVLLHDLDQGRLNSYKPINYVQVKRVISYFRSHNINIAQVSTM